MTPIGRLPVALAAALLPPHSSPLLSHALDAEPVLLPVVVPVAPDPVLRPLPCADRGSEFVDVPPHETIRGATPSNNAMEKHFIMFSSRAADNFRAKYCRLEV